MIEFHLTQRAATQKVPQARMGGKPLEINAVSAAFGREMADRVQVQQNPPSPLFFHRERA
ncbi:hypothetical protein [Oceanomicrobium pacificus]|uniref:Uncharacterized protein n=1 Tax=Oceanomicrobium pacificus TaxID=2692916 RepID=A0A6B0TY65_9RHOB|nr:hypothetical protein [Oceanomicrobium pacificus]MXU65943.1 hypothetical protein [Oceanomicrobium pacificus]